MLEFSRGFPLKVCILNGYVLRTYYLPKTKVCCWDTLTFPSKNYVQRKRKKNKIKFKEEEFQILFASLNFSTVPPDNLGKFSNHNKTTSNFISLSHFLEVAKYLPLSMKLASSKLTDTLSLNIENVLQSFVKLMDFWLV